jgi:hypothetical protein
MDQNPNTSKGKHLAEMLVDSLCGLATEAEMETVRESLIAERKIIDDMKLNKITPAENLTEAEVAPAFSPTHPTQSVAAGFGVGLVAGLVVGLALRSQKGEGEPSTPESLVESADKSNEGTPNSNDNS